MRPAIASHAETRPDSDRPFIVGVVTTLAWGVLSFGAVYPWAFVPLAMACASLGLWGLVTARRRRAGWGDGALIAAFTVMGLAVGAQLLPVSRTALRAISPATDAFLGEYEVGYAFLDAHPLSIRPADTLLGLGLLIAFGLLIMGAARRLTTRACTRLAGGLVVLGAAIAVEAIIQRAFTTRAVYGFWYPYNETDSVFGPFVNRNHFAGWMLMALPLASAYFFATLRRTARGMTGDWRQRIVWLASSEASRTMLAGFAIVLMTLSLLLTLSRSAMASFAVTALVCGAIVVRRARTAARRTAVVGYLVALAAISIGWAGADRLTTRFAATTAADVSFRLNAWRDAAFIIREFPLTGTGLSTYPTAVVLYEPPNADKRFNEAHNDYLQLAAEGGLLLCAPALALIIVFATLVRRRFAGDTDPIALWMRTGAATGIMAVALQEVVDFSLQMPGNAALFAVLCAIALHRPRTAEPA